MTTFNTGNAVPSTDGRDLSDNAETIDAIVNGTGTSTLSRLGKSLTTLKTLEEQYVFTAINNGVWAAGQTFTAVNQFMVFSGTAYKPKNSTTLPYAVGATPVGDANVEVVGNLSTAQADAIYDKKSTLAEATADTTIVVGMSRRITDRSDGIFDVVAGETPNGFDIIAHDTLSLQWKLRVSENMNLIMFGAIDKSASFNSLLNIEAGLKFCAANNVTCDWAGDFRINDELVIDTNYNGLVTIGKMKLRLFGTFAVNKAAFHVPTNTDNFGGLVAGATDMRLAHVEGDCTNASASTAFTAGIAIYGGQNNHFDTLEGHDALKMGVSVGSVSGTPVSMTINKVIGFNADDGSQTAGQGFASALDNKDDDNVHITSMTLTDNAIFGVDFSTGPITVGYLFTARNGQPTTGGAGKFAGTGSNRTQIGTWVSLDDEAGPVTNGTQELMSIEKMIVIDCLDQGFKIADAGVYKIGHFYSNNATNNGFQQTAGDVHIGTLQGDGNGSNLGACTGGNIHVDVIDSKNHATGGAFVVSTTGSGTYGSAKSSEDRDGCIRFVGASTQYSGGDVEIAHATLSAPGVFLNGSPTGAKVGKITASGTAIEFSDAATATVRERTIFNLTTTLDPASIAIGASLKTNHTVTGAELGDFVDISFAKDLEGLTLTGYVSSANTVSSVFSNNTAGAVDLTSATLRIKCESVN